MIFFSIQNQIITNTHTCLERVVTDLCALATNHYRKLFLSFHESLAKWFRP